MKLYAAFGEYGDIWPTTIRRTSIQAVLALREEPAMEGRADIFSGGVCIGEFDYGGEVIGGLDFSGCIDKPFPPKPETVTWLYGYRAKKARGE